MKKRMTALLLSILTVLTVFPAVLASAAVYTGYHTVDSAWTEERVWAYDTDEQILTIGGDRLYLEDPAAPPWKQYEGKISHIELSPGLNFVGGNAVDTILSLARKAKTIGAEMDGFRWVYDTEALTLTLSGEGDWPMTTEYSYWCQWVYLEYYSHPKTIVIGDGITAIPNTLLVGQDVQIGRNTELINIYDGHWVQGGYTAHPGNPYYNTYEGCLYTKEWELLTVPRGKTAPETNPGMENDVNRPYTGFVTEEGGVLYYQDGAQLKNDWLYLDGVWYRLDKEGYRIEDRWEKVGGAWYRFDAEGKMAENCWKKIDGVWYHFSGSGAMSCSRWVKSGGKWYWLTGSGEMAENRWIEYKGDWYYLGADGAMLENTVTPDGFKVDESGRWMEFLCG